MQVVPDVNPKAHYCALRGDLRCKLRRSWNFFTFAASLVRDIRRTPALADIHVHTHVILPEP